MEQAMELVKELATNLGVAVEYLWGTLVRQQYAEGITNLVSAALWLIFGICLAVFAPKFTKHAHTEYVKEKKNRLNGGYTGYFSRTTTSDREDFYYGARWAIPIAAVILGIVAIFMVGCYISTGIQQLINPDYFALKEILDTIKTG